MSVQSAIGNQARSCTRCVDAITEKEKKRAKGEQVAPYKPQHCHCALLKPDHELLENLGEDINMMKKIEEKLLHRKL